MGTIKSFKEIIAWEKAHKLTLEVYSLTKKFPRFEEFGLANQMRRAAVSIPSNIAEGFKRRSLKDSTHFYNMAEGSLEELKYQLLLSRDLDYLEKVHYEKIEFLGDEVGKLLNSWKKAQKY